MESGGSSAAAAACKVLFVRQAQPVAVCPPRGRGGVFLSTAKPFAEGAWCWHGLRELSRHAREHIKFCNARLPGPSADQRKAPGRAQSTGKRQAPNVPMRMSQTRLRSISCTRGSILLRVRVSCRGRVGSGRTCNLSVAVCLHCVGILFGGTVAVRPDDLLRCVARHRPLKGAVALGPRRSAEATGRARPLPVGGPGLQGCCAHGPEF
jgi:hypothetical protein